MSDHEDPAPRGKAPLLIVAGVLAIVGAFALIIVLVLPSATSAPPVTPAALPSPSAREQGSRLVGKGECVSIEGTEQEPLLNIISCGPGGYRVLQRFDGTIDAENICKDVPGYEYNYSYDSALDPLDFVLCLKQLS